MKKLRYRALMGLLLLGFGVAMAGAPAALQREPTAADPITAQAAGVAEWLDPTRADGEAATGSELFDDEWTFGAWQMAALGFAQHATTHPDALASDLARMDLCLERVVSDRGRAFDTGQWGVDPLQALDGTTGHAAWLGYTNLDLSARRALEPEGRWAALNDQLSEAIVRRLDVDLLPETYPGQRYPVDVAAGVASVGLWAKATGRPEPVVLARWRTALRDRWIVDGMLAQTARADGTPGVPRGSGTFLASWFLSFWAPDLAKDLYFSGRDQLLVTLGPLVAMREYAPGVDGRGDIDSGPIVAGMGVSATGFAIGAARAAGDETTARQLESSASLIGQPETVAGATHWKTGKALGSAPLADAILFAMMGTPRRVGGTLLDPG